MRPSRLRWVLLASVSVNLLVIGALVGAMLSGGPRGDDARPSSGGQFEMTGLVRNLDGRDRRGLVQALRRDGVLRAAREDLRAARSAVQAALRAEPFDRAAVDAAVAAQLTAQQVVAERGAAIVVDMIGELPAEERGALLERLSQPRRRGD